VSSPGPVRTGYHHGDLRNALIHAAAELAQSGGPDSVTIRAAARAVGVTPTAAYRHFTGHEDLLGAAKECCLERMSEAMDTELARLPESGDRVRRALRRLAALGRGYLAFVAAEPGLFRTAFAQGLPLVSPVESAWEAGPFLKVIEVLDELMAAGFLPAERRPMAEVSVWSAVHGLAMLHLDGPLGDLDDESRQRAIERTFEVIVAGLGCRGLPDDLHTELIEIVGGR
jgi:AcrR family transcriptional regulator